MTDPIIGTTVLNRYRIVARLAAGGMGVVYLARVEGAAGFAKPVVVKRILPEHTANENMARLFVREAKILANLQHPNIVGVTDFGEEGGAYIMVLDYVRAYHLGLWLYYREACHEKLPVAFAIHVMTKVLEALEYAHTLTLPDGTPLDVIHADISPSNILVDMDGQVRLLDFGIARMRGEVTKSTDAASIRGKLAYLPVEALDGSVPQITTDVYACGVTLYEFLAGTNPFSVDDDTVTIARVISHQPPPISTLRPEAPPELDGILARAMSKDRAQRFATAKDFARELRRIQPLPEGEAAAGLAALAKHDYALMPSMSEVGALSLSELEEAWRNPPEPPSSTRTVVPSRGSELQFAATEPPDPRAPTRGLPAELPPKGRGAIYAVSALFVVLVGVATTIAVVVLKRPTVEPSVILVEHAPTTSASTVLTAATSIAALEPSASASALTPRVPAKPPQDPITAAFTKNMPSIDACFQSHASDITGSPEMSLRISFDKNGVVETAELTPAELEGTPVGQCVVVVAKRTQFPPQPGPTRFSIPLRARRSQ